jgi:hypothetical protein
LLKRKDDYTRSLYTPREEGVKDKRLNHSREQKIKNGNELAGSIHPVPY